MVSHSPLWFIVVLTIFGPPILALIFYVGAKGMVRAIYFGSGRKDIPGWLYRLIRIGFWVILSGNYIIFAVTIFKSGYFRHY
jgi:hypothetical protein